MNHFFQKLSCAWRMKVMRRELASLSDGQLDDIGICRAQIPDFTRYCHGTGPRPSSV